jgi:UDP-N-acetylmuramoylalanine--D-glutamate ligase
MKKLIDNLKDKNILILGFGKEGKSTYRWLRYHFPDKLLGVADKNSNIISLIEDEHVNFHVEEDYLSSINEYDIIIKSPGISLKDKKYRNSGKITSQTDIFLEYFKEQTIGVTGTKGKSTTSSLIAHILKGAGKNVILLGNIGIPAFDKIEEIDKGTIVVFELSAHQLEFVDHSPKVAVLLNIFPEHLDHFDSFESYMKAKLNIGKFQDYNDVMIVDKNQKKYIELFKSNKLFIEEVDINEEDILLKGNHNRRNLDAAFKAVNVFGISREKSQAAISTFKPLSHRLEYIGQYGGIHFYNDSIATVPEATIEAVKAIGEVNTIILGGFDRGLDYAEMLCFLRDDKNIKNMIFTGPAGEIMLKMVTTQSADGKNYYFAKDMEEVFEIIKNNVPKESVCLLSPAAASYDSYHNFEHRGEEFKQRALKINEITQNKK